jgi:hypothetical protein
VGSVSSTSDSAGTFPIARSGLVGRAATIRWDILFNSFCAKPQIVKHAAEE